MSPVGHTLTGLAIGYIAFPKGTRRSEDAYGMLAVALLANAPDWPLPYWGHDRYDISHSIFSTSLAVSLAILIALLCSKFVHRVPPRWILAGAVAWFSHLLLDTFYNHGKGLAIFWPFGSGRVALPIPWFNTLKLNPPVYYHNLKVVTIEAVCFGLLFASIVLGKRWLNDQPRDHPTV